MEFLLVLAGSIIGVVLLSKSIKKCPIVFYLLAVALNVLYVVSVYGTLPVGAWQLLFLLMQKCTLAFALFTIVMFIGVFSRISQVSMRLRPIRAELSIMACILAVGHMVVYLMAFLPRLTSGAFDGDFVIFFTTAVVLLVLLAILGLTSLKKIRFKMDQLFWRKLQKWAYVFFGLVYVHLISILLPSALSGGEAAQVSVTIYSVLFALYVILRIRRAMLDKKMAQAIDNK